MKKNFERGNQRCGFYDAQPPHGGPEESRERRAADDDLRWFFTFIQYIIKSYENLWQFYENFTQVLKFKLKNNSDTTEVIQLLEPVKSLAVLKNGLVDTLLLALARKITTIR